MTGEGAEAAADWDDLMSGETYLGWAQTTGFASPSGLLPESNARLSADRTAHEAPNHDLAASSLAACSAW